MTVIFPGEACHLNEPCRAEEPGCRLRVAIALASVAIVLGCDASRKPVDQPSKTAAKPSWTQFEDVAAEAGLDFVHFNGMSGEFYFCETVGPGVAVFDYDLDGDLDLFVVQGHMLGPHDPSSATFPPAADAELTDRLYRNLLSETGQLRFEDATESAQIDSRGYGMGVAVGDYDGNGYPDLLITNFGDNALLRNNGDGTFSDTTAEAVVEDSRWNTSAAFVDYDSDGDLDLFVCAYVKFTLGNHKPCYSETSARDYCGPLSYAPEPDRLYRNNGDGSFDDVSASTRITTAFGSALGVVASDYNGDGRLDLFVANDGLPNQLWIQTADATFEDDALLAACAFNQDGVAEASMGVDAEDFDGDGDDDLFMTHLNGETNTLYVNNGHGQFDDETFSFRLGVASRNFTGFGTAWVDADNDGWLDLFCANGAVKTIEKLARAGDPYPMHQTNQLFRNSGGKSFQDVSAESGGAFARSEVSRGAAFGDLDNDGDSDIVVANNSGALRILRNDVRDSRWIGVSAIHGSPARFAIGARIEVTLNDGSSLFRNVKRAASYCSSNDPRRIIGLRGRASVQKIRIRWPDGTRESWTGLALGEYHRLVRGSGRSEG